MPVIRHSFFCVIRASQLDILRRALNPKVEVFGEAWPVVKADRIPTYEEIVNPFAVELPQQILEVLVQARSLFSLSRLPRPFARWPQGAYCRMLVARRASLAAPYPYEKPILHLAKFVGARGPVLHVP